MKKFLSMLLVVVLCLTGLIACGNNDEDLAALEDAATYLNTMYKDKTTNTPNDYDVVAKVVVGGKTYTVTWTTSNENVVVKESSKTGFWTIDVPAMVTEEIAYTLTATIADANGNTATKSFNRVVPVVDKTGIVTDPQEGTAYKFFLEQVTLGQTLFATTNIDGGKYLATVTDAKQAPDFYVEKVDGGIKIYTMIDNAKMYLEAYLADGTSKRLKYVSETACVFTYKAETNAYYTEIDSGSYVLGTYGTYNTFSISDAVHMTPEVTGVTQFPALFMEKAYAESLSPSEAPTIYNTPEEIVNAAYALEAGAALSGAHKYTLTGVITAVNSAYSEQYGNVTVTIVVAGMTDKPIECFRLKGTGADVIAVGDTITVTGVIKNYNGKVEFDAGCTLDSYTNGEGGGSTTPDTPTTNMGVVTEVAVDTAYKFGMVQGNVSNKTFYITSGMASTYYFATTEAAASGIDFYLEATEGGYYLYIMENGAKTYVNMTVVTNNSGTHVNGKYEATATTVYTFDATAGTIVADVNGTPYCFGTKNSGTFTTVGPVKVEEAFKCQFYTATEGGEDVGGGDEGGSQTPDVITTIPEALAAANGANVVLTGTVVRMYEEWSSYNNCSPYIQDADGNQILVFRTTTKVHVGDVITVTGTITLYGDANQVAQGSTAVIVTEHTHTYSEATCTVAPACTSCGISNGEPALGHTEANAEGKCDRCGLDFGASYTEATISFADAANRTSYSENSQVWSQNGITVTNNKGASTQPVKDYTNPVRFYANTELIVEANNIAKIVFECNTPSYASALQGAIEAADGVTVTINGSSVTIEFAETVNSFTVAKLTAQVRVNSITVTSKG